VVLNTDGRDFAVPILVTDLVALPATAAGASLGLDELLLLLTRRVGVERAVQLAQQRATNAGEGPEALFGEVFGPTDVFRAWWSVAEDLSDPALSVLAFRLRLEGALGVGEAWRHMAEAVADRTLPAAEVWLYGAELVRTLDDVELPSAADRDAKAACLSTLRTRVHEDLRNLGFEPGPHPWMRHVLEFYGVDAS
jgi:hypothetical protein